MIYHIKLLKFLFKEVWNRTNCPVVATKWTRLWDTAPINFFWLVVLVSKAIKKLYNSPPSQNGWWGYYSLRFNLYYELYLASSFLRSIASHTQKIASKKMPFDEYLLNPSFVCVEKVYLVNGLNCFVIQIIGFQLS